ncbi:MAG: NADH-quinone oxidoreductase subunit E, partial [Deltaproteobacteria bacterium]
EPELTPEAVRRIARQLDIPEADAWGTARFYGLLRDKGAGTRVCQSISCRLAGSDEWIAALRDAGEPHVAVSCLGQCDRAPVALDDDLRVLARGRPGAVMPADDSLPIDLGGVDDARYAALARAREMGAAAVIDEIDAAGLQGRGGAGFPAAFKWRAVAAEAEPVHYVVVNADEGEPGTFKDREVMRRRPHRLIEGLAIAAEAVGARQAWIYIRGEFHEERASLERALDEARPHLGDLEIHFANGHGAYICGEETALLESLEGRRGMPRIKPPYPTRHGLWGKPTLIHNVETLACVPYIVRQGGAAFRALGRTEPGTKLYCISGHVRQPGVYELPLGVTLDELLEVAGGPVGTPRAFSPGGASSGFLPIDQSDQPLDFQGLAARGSMLGSAGVVVLNDTVDMAQAARWQAVFFEEESCGQCAPCRLGTQVLRKMLDRYLDHGDPDALRHLEDIAFELEEGSICGLGMVAHLPLVTAIRYFPGDFAARAPATTGGASSPTSPPVDQP